MSFSPTDPLEKSPVRQFWRAQIVSKTEVAPRHFQMRLAAPGFGNLACPGQFIHVKAQASSAQNAPTAFGTPLLRRAFSIMETDESGLEILFRIEGAGTQALAQAREGEWLDFLGPLGQGFDLSLFHVKQNPSNENVSRETAVLVGGGVGVPPLVFLAKKLREKGVVTSAILGARTGSDVLCESQFEATGVQTLVCTDDGSRGFHGRVTDLLEPLLTDSPVTVYACGPLPMLRAVALLCQSSGQKCQVSLEENMPCGVGVCNGCVVKVVADENSGGGDYDLYRRICVYGPVCNGEDIDWEAN